MSETTLADATARAHRPSLTDTAAAKAKSLPSQEGRDDLSLRVAVQPGGCSGLRYQLFFDERSLDGDVVKDIRQSDRITHVMINGRLYESATMNEVGAAPKKRKPFFFEGADGANAPVPTTSRQRESGRDRKVDASADAAPVRRNVSASPSISASGLPVPASCSR